MARPDLYGMPETDASKLQGDNDVLRAENERLKGWMAHLSKRLEQRDIQVTALSAELRKLKQSE